MWNKLLEISKNSDKNLRIKGAKKIIDAEEDVSKLKNTLEAAIREIGILQEKIKSTEQQKESTNKQPSKRRNGVPLGAKLEKLKARQVETPENDVKTLGQFAIKGEKYGR